MITEDGAPVTKYKINGETINDAEGKFEVIVSCCEQERLVFVAQGLASTVRIFDVHAGLDTSLPKVTLTKGRVLKGRILDVVTRAPIADALVDVTETPMDAQRETHLSEDWGAVRSRADGTFMLRLEESAPTLVVMHERYLQRWFPLIREQTEIFVELDSGATLKGTAKKPTLDGAEVKLVRKDGGVSREGLVENGSYKLFGIPAGTYFLTVWDVCAPRPRHPLIGPKALKIPKRGTVTYNLR